MFGKWRTITTIIDDPKLIVEIYESLFVRRTKYNTGHSITTIDITWYILVHLNIFRILERTLSYQSLTNII